MSNGNEAIYKDLILKIGNKLMAGLTSWDWQTSVDSLETTNFQTANDRKTFKPGRVGETISLEGIHDPNKGATTMQDFWDLRSMVKNRTIATIRIYENYTTNGKYTEFTGFVSNLSKKAQDNAVINISASFQITGDETTGALT